ncbi:ATP-dependent DNA helicase RecG [Heliorestis acidaminivorans]|uniref:ATP-dependent DNA helicase RecG n=1 Tax=Heliorestis acidaminivorans TaxID=553427 RepID=A0A6I0F6K1_9FIRM|nr:ATP-dependent DNA helicase RecG [Heliorestis acidaminivorans]KAB2954457.1 ATP-dependent DNA helicase RecG [Heliorestis acidaminivorans]
MSWRPLWIELRRSIDAERNLGYTDGAVIGGFSRYAQTMLTSILQKLSEESGPFKARLALWERQMSNYRSLSKAERKKIVEELAEALKEVEIEKPELFQKKEANQQEAQAKASSVQKGPGTAIQFLKGVGPQRALKMKKMGIETIEDLFFHIPFRYIDRSQIVKISQIYGPGEVTVAGVIRAYQEWQPRRGLTVIRGRLDDGTGILSLLWFNRKQMMKQYPPGSAVMVSGKVEYAYGKAELTVQEIELQEEAGLHTGRLIPVYPATEGIHQRYLRKLFEQVFQNYRHILEDIVPREVRQQLDYLPLDKALQALHFPHSLEEAENGRSGLVFDEVFLLQCALHYLRQQKKDTSRGFVHGRGDEELRRFWSLLPFKLTGAQQRVIQEISSDMASPRPMNRLLQGDVGSGKTVVAASAVVKAVSSGYQAAFMAPTEVLAEQHAINWQKLLAPIGIAVAHLSGSSGRRKREEVLQGLLEGSISVVIGTHALIQKDVRFKKLALVIIDEQHRFGVKQRSALWEKGKGADLLVMTATPIPRTLAMTIYGDLDVSVLNERPPGRQSIKTYHLSSKTWPRIYNLIRREVKAGFQAYVLCPSIEESETMDLAAVEERYEILSRDIFPDLKVAIMHGRLKKDEKASVMEAFSQGKIDILVTTTVIEVGIDVPNATVMIIEDAERFGLAQLHQIRGRVGRNSHESYCILVADRLTEEGRLRMKAMEKSNDGFLLAEEDLKLRGPGEMLGTRQSGIPAFKVADLTRDGAIMETAQIASRSYLEKYPQLDNPESKALRKKIAHTFQGLDLL